MIQMNKKIKHIPTVFRQIVNKFNETRYLKVHKTRV